MAHPVVVVASIPLDCNKSNSMPVFIGRCISFFFSTDQVMRNSIIVYALIIIFSNYASAADRLVAPDWTLVAADGQTVNLNDEVQKQTTLLLFWAPWCPYCKTLMPHLQSVVLEYGDKVKVLAINIKEDGDPVEFIESAGYDFTLFPNGDDVADTYEVTGTPGVIVVDHNRVIRFDLRRLPVIEPRSIDKPAVYRSRAAYRAPYWAAEIRQSLDAILEDQMQAEIRGAH